MTESMTNDKHIKLVTIAKYIYKMGVISDIFDLNGLKFTLFTNHNRVVFNDLGIYYCFYKNMDYRDMCTDKWMLENNIKFEDMTIADAEVLKFYRECKAV